MFLTDFFNRFFCSVSLRILTFDRISRFYWYSRYREDKLFHISLFTVFSSFWNTKKSGAQRKYDMSAEQNLSELTMWFIYLCNFCDVILKNNILINFFSFESGMWLEISVCHCNFFGRYLRWHLKLSLPFSASGLLPARFWWPMKKWGTKFQAKVTEII